VGRPTKERRRGIKREKNRSERGWCGQGENELPPGFGRGTERSISEKLKKLNMTAEGGMARQEEGDQIFFLRERTDSKRQTSGNSQRSAEIAKGKDAVCV
jgi:hypothetical protein